MAKHEFTKQARAAQKAAVEPQFEEYKSFISRKVIEKFGGSYKTYEEFKDTWRSVFRYEPAIESFLIEKTIFFLDNLPVDGIHNSHSFLDKLSDKISTYLAIYSHSPSSEADFQKTKERIKQKIFTQNKRLQGRTQRCEIEMQRKISADILEKRKQYEQELAYEAHQNSASLEPIDIQVTIKFHTREQRWALLNEIAATDARLKKLGCDIKTKTSR